MLILLKPTLARMKSSLRVIRDGSEEDGLSTHRINGTRKDEVVSGKGIGWVILLVSEIVSSCIDDVRNSSGRSV